MLRRKFDAIFHICIENSTQMFHRGFLHSRLFSKQKFDANWKFLMQFGHIRRNSIDILVVRNASRLYQIEATFKKSGWSDHTRSRGIQFHILLGSRHRIYTLRRQRFVKRAYILFQIPNRECSINWCHHGLIGTLKEVALEWLISI